MSKVYLYHHGIEGQKWGKRNGPPYPLDREDYSAEEKRKNPTLRGAIAGTGRLNRADEKRVKQVYKYNKATSKLKEYEKYTRSKKGKGKYNAEKHEKLKQQKALTEAKMHESEQRIEQAIMDLEDRGYIVNSKEAARHYVPVGQTIVRDLLLGTMSWSRIGLDLSDNATGYNMYAGKFYNVKRPKKEKKR